MAYEVFVEKVTALIERAGGGIEVRFSNDIDAGKYIAKCSDGTMIIGVPSSLRVTVRYGARHSHMAMAEI